MDLCLDIYGNEFMFRMFFGEYFLVSSGLWLNGLRFSDTFWFVEIWLGRDGWGLLSQRKGGWIISGEVGSLKY